jgi:hypothetical protein
MLTGIRLRAHPKPYQKQILSQWMGSARTIWNAKCEEERYHTRFARRFCLMGTYAPIDQSFSQYKHKTPSRCLPSWKGLFQHHTSQECAACGHTHPENRRSQSRLIGSSVALASSSSD